MPITNPQIAQDVSDLITKRVQIDTEFATWLSGPAGGGAGSDGKFPLTDYTGISRLVESPDQLASGIGGSASAAAASAAAALVSENAAAASASAASIDEGLADAHRIAAISAQSLAEAARDSALSAEANALASQNAAASSESNAATSESNAATSEANALASEIAAAASEAAAATFNPVLYAALADNETVAGQYTFSHASGILIGAAPLTAALIGNWNTAYGWGDHAGLYTKSVAAAPADLDTLNAPANDGIYRWAGVAPTNAPNAQTYMAMLSFDDGSQMNQLAFGYGNAANRHKLFVRRNTSGTWDNWTEFWSTDYFSSADITNWNTAFGWGDHAGLYANVSHTHPATEITAGALPSGVQPYINATATNANYRVVLSSASDASANTDLFRDSTASLYYNPSTNILTATSVHAPTDVATDRIRAYTSGPLILNAGESNQYATGQAAENVYINAEAGLMVTSSPDNWGSAWAGRNTAVVINDATGLSSFNSVNVGGELTLSNTLRMENGVYQYWKDTLGTLVPLLTFWTNDDFYVGNGGYPLILRGSANTVQGATTFQNGVTVSGSLTASAGMSLTGDLTTIDAYLDVKRSTTGASGVRVLNSAGTTQGYLYADGSGTFGLLGSGGSWAVQIAPASTTVTFPGNVNANLGLDVTGNITVTGTVDGIDIAAIPSTYEPAFAKNNAFNLSQAAHGVAGLSYVPRTNSTSSAGQWITIATNPLGLDVTLAPTGAGGSRSTARFILTDQTSGRHETLEIYAACHYGQRPVLRVIGHHYGTQIWTKARIVNGSTYDGHALQVYCTAASTGFHVYMLENFQTPGWSLRTPVAQVPEGSWSVAEECDTAGWNIQAGNARRGMGVDMNGVLSLNHDTNSAKLSWNTVGQYGNLMISGDELGAYLGVSLNNYSVFMDAQNGPAGIYNDTQNEWKIRFDSNNSDVLLNFGGSTRLATTSAGVSVTGDIAVTGTVDGIDIAALNTTVGTKAPSASPTFTGAVNMPEDVDFPYGIHGGYTSNASTAWGATIWSLDTAYNGGEAAANSANTSVYGIRWIRSTHTGAATSIGEGLYVYQNGVLQAGMGTAGIYSSGGCYVTGELNLGHLTDTSITRVSAGKIEVEGKPVIKHASATYNSGEVTFSTSAPSGGADGDIWFEYT